MKITVEKLRELNACDSGIEYFKSKHSDAVELIDLIREDIATNYWRILNYASWLIQRCMTHEQHIDYIIYSAELALPEYEEKYPNEPHVYNCRRAIKDFRDGKITKEELLVAVYGIEQTADDITGINATIIKILQYGITLLEAENE